MCVLSWYCDLAILLIKKLQQNFHHLHWYICVLKINFDIFEGQKLRRLHSLQSKIWFGSDLGRRFFCSVTVSDSCLHDLLPKWQDSEILFRLRRHTVYPIPRSKTNKCRSLIHYALLKYQWSNKITSLLLLAKQIYAFSALTLLVVQEKGHPARKNFWFETPWDIVLAVIVSGRHTRLPLCARYSASLPRW